MVTKRWFGLFTGLICLVIILGYLVVSSSPVEAQPKNVVGSWNVKINVILQNATFPGLLSFFSDGNVLADESPSPLETSGHGNWISIGKNEFAYTFVVLVGSNDPTKWMVYTVNGHGKLSQDGDLWKGPFTIDVTDQDGTLIFADSGTMSGARITARP